MNESSLFLIGVGIVSLGLVLTQTVFYRLKNAHGRVWEELGRPHIIFNNTPSHTFRWMRFLRKREYKSLDDPVLIWLSRLIICLNFSVLVWLALMFWTIIQK